MAVFKTKLNEMFGQKAQRSHYCNFESEVKIARHFRMSKSQNGVPLDVIMAKLLAEGYIPNPDKPAGEKK